jgi:hypothetical protein
VRKQPDEFTRFSHLHDGQDGPWQKNDSKIEEPLFASPLPTSPLPTSPLEKDRTLMDEGTVIINLSKANSKES